MSNSIQNPFLQLKINPAWSTWSLSSNQARGPVVENAHISVYYHLGRNRYKLPGDNRVEAGNTEVVSSVHGTLRQVTLLSAADYNGIRIRFTFALPQDQPFLLFRAAVENQGAQPVQVERLEVMNAGFVFVPTSAGSVSGYVRQGQKAAPNGVVRLAPESGDLAFFSNGWQSWNYTGVYGLGDRFKRTRLGPLTAPMRVNAGTPQPGGGSLFTSDMFGVLGDRNHRSGLLLGFLSQEQQFGSLEALIDPFMPALRMWANGDRARLDPGSQMVTDWAYAQFLHLDNPDPLAVYMDAAARENNAGEKAQGAIPAGWCSWYYFYQKVTAANVRENLAAAADLQPRLPLDLFQIDDGFESQVGDWFTFAPAFPDGVKPLAEEINQKGFTPGLWLAPFIVHPKSKLFKEHPEWLLRNRSGRPVNAGYVWDVFNTALDLTIPSALDYAREVVSTAAHKWGFPFLKLDFLYAAALPGLYSDPTQTRAQVMRKGLLALREAAGPDTFLLGCGCPLGSAIGIVNAMRIGSDVDQRWHPAYRGIELFFRPEPDFPSARNAIHNAITRSPMHRRWWLNDPDCLLVRPPSDGKGLARLTLAEVQTLATVIALTGGALLISEDLPALDDERLHIAEALLPLIGKAAHVLDWFDASSPRRLQLDLNGPAGRWHLVGLLNWSDRPRDLTFLPSEFYLEGTHGYIARSFWDGAIHRIDRKQGQLSELVFRNVPPHGTVLLSIRPVHGSAPQYLGSNLHISQGMEVADWVWEAAPGSGTDKAGGVLRFRLQRPGPAASEVDIYLPSQPTRATLNGEPVRWTAKTDGVYSFPVRFEKEGRVEIYV